MRVQVNTDNNIPGDESLEAHVEEVVTSTLSRFSQDVTRVEVHLQDENSHKGGSDDIRCMMEARVEGMQPTAVTHNAGNVKDAINGAVRKLRNALTTSLGRRNNHR